MTAEIETLKRNTPPAILAAARRLSASDVAHYPKVAPLLARMQALDAQQVAARQRADEARAVIDAIANKRAVAEAALHDAEHARDLAAGEALLGEPEREKEYHSACFAVAKAERTVAMFDLGKPALVAAHDLLMSEVRGYGIQCSRIGEELADERFKASIAEAKMRNAARR